MIYYRVALDVPLPLVLKVSILLAKHREEIGTRSGTRALTCWRQAIFILAWFRDKPDLHRLGQGFGISQATAYRYKDEGAAVLAAKAPTLHEALEKATEQGLPYLILDGTLIASDRCSDKKTSRKGEQVDKWYSGKAHHHAGLVQGLAGPDGIPRWASDALPGSTHDITAAREQVLPTARPYLGKLPVLAGSGYEGAGKGVHVPVKKPRKGASTPPHGHRSRPPSKRDSILPTEPRTVTTRCHLRHRQRPSPQSPPSEITGRAAAISSSPR